MKASRASLATPSVLILLAGGFGLSAQEGAKGIEFFETKIRPALATHCYECHSAQSAKLKGGLKLDSREGIRAGGDTGPGVVPGRPSESLVLKALRHEAKLEMPPKKKLPASVAADFEQWIAMGAPDPREAGASAGYKRMTPEEARQFWAFQAVKPVAAPKVKNTAWPRADMDRFILAALEEKKLAPVADADRRTLLRRLNFDIIGLPPTPEEIASFLNDKSAAATEKVVDRLLASPHFGERWGRHWLDVARFAESNGNADNTPFPHAWRYRDYVIASYNADKPYDQFVREQIAGDLLPASDSRQRDVQIIATGFLALTSKPRAQNNPDYLMDLVADQIDVTTRGVLGLSVMCARCHDHKFDAIAQKEYYALAGFFESSTMLAGAGRPANNKKQAGADALHDLSDGNQCMGVKDGKVTDTALCVRGESQKRGDRVPRGFLAVTHTAPVPEINRTQSGRAELAKWLTDSQNPLTARVAVNRVWLHLFGRGLVGSADNFGALGERPTHPALLDHLAASFMQQGWSTKKLIRAIVLSRTYQLSGTHAAASYAVDPDNTLHWRMSPRRLEGEPIRDAILAISGKMESTPPGKSLASVAGNNAKRPIYTASEANVRSVYLGIARGAALPEVLALFDMANPNIVVAQREVTTVPTQSLFLMNSPWLVKQAEAFAARLLAEKVADDAARVDLAYQMALARLPAQAERAAALAHVRQWAETHKAAPEKAWASLCQALFASAEFRYVQ
ncbi:MAG: DUF1553 domain-containing protein [Pedosphaera sp.]|nr:DUF1553 domain-containing protein [Pedosphaera sp.]MSU43641.1 DUF1553 domain-containing protein [Pedosphaera sp.]